MKRIFPSLILKPTFNNSTVRWLLATAMVGCSISVLANYPDDFSRWKQQKMESYQQYKDERDQAFTDFLKKQWKEVDTKPGEVRDKTPKPLDIPMATLEPLLPIEMKELPVVTLPPKIIQPLADLPEQQFKPLDPPATPITKKADPAPLEQQPIAKAPKPDPFKLNPMTMPEATTMKPLTLNEPEFKPKTFDAPNDFEAPQDLEQPKGFNRPKEPELSPFDKPEPLTLEPITQPKQIPEFKPEPMPQPPVASIPPKTAPKPAPQLPDTSSQSSVEQPKASEPIVKTPKQTPPVIQPIIVEKPKATPPAKTYSGKKLTFEFFGHTTQVTVDHALISKISTRVNADAISKGWSDLSLADYDSTLEQLKQIENKHNLGDWGKVQLVFALTKAMHPNDVNNQSFTSWFLLVKQDYQARMAYNTAGVYLLVPAQQDLYEVTFFTFNGKRFYAVSPDGKPRELGQVFTYDGDYPKAVVPVNMTDKLAFQNESNYRQRNFKFSFNGKSYRINLNVNPARVQYFASYPQMDIDQYFISPVDMITANDTLDHFRPLLEGKSELEAVNLLLRFVQTGFEYQTDDQQFGEENYLFAEETLTMPASDCEDRSVLFAWLVRELLGLEVVGLDYPGHIAAAVRFSKPVKGDNIQFNGKTFTITDPTYINANAGMTMPEVAAHQPKVISIQ